MLEIDQRIFRVSRKYKGFCLKTKTENWHCYGKWFTLKMSLSNQNCPVGHLIVILVACKVTILTEKFLFMTITQCHLLDASVNGAPSALDLSRIIGCYVFHL